MSNATADTESHGIGTTDSYEGLNADEIRERPDTPTVRVQDREIALHQLVSDLQETKEEIESQKAEVFRYREACEEEMVLALNQDDEELARLYRDAAELADVVLNLLLQSGEEAGYEVTD